MRIGYNNLHANFCMNGTNVECATEENMRVSTREELKWETFNAAKLWIMQRKYLGR